MSYTDVVLADNPLCFLQLGDQGGNFGDSGPNHLFGTPHGTLTRSVPTGFAGLPRGVTFGGTVSDYIDLGTDSRFDLLGDFTYECWSAYTSRANFQMLMGKGWQDASNAGYVLYLITGTGVIEVERSSLTGLGSSSVALLNDGLFHQVFVTRSGNNYTVVIDGAVVNTFSTAQAIQATTRSFLVGEAFYNASGIIDPFTGSMAAVSVYDHFVSPGRAAIHWGARNSVSPEVLVPSAGRSRFA